MIILVEKGTFFPGMLGGAFFVLYNLYATGSLRYEFGPF